MKVAGALSSYWPKVSSITFILMSREWLAYAEWYIVWLLVFSDVVKPLLALVIFDTSLSRSRMSCAECYMSLRGSLSWWDHLRCTHPHTEFELYQWVTYSELVHQVAQLCGIICTGFIAIPWWQDSYYWISQIMNIDISVLITSHTDIFSLCDQPEYQSGQLVYQQWIL